MNSVDAAVTVGGLAADCSMLYMFYVYAAKPNMKSHRNIIIGLTFVNLRIIEICVNFVEMCTIEGTLCQRNTNGNMSLQTFLILPLHGNLQ